MGCMHRNTATRFGTEKLEWCSTRRWRKVWRYVYSFRHNTWTWQTDGHRTAAQAALVHIIARKKTPFDDHPVEISRNRKERRRLESWQKYSAQSSRSHSTLASITLCRPVYRGHAYKLYKLRCSSVRVMFACSVITVWNSLPDVVNFTSLLAFNQSTRTVDFHEFLLCNNE